MTTLPSLNELVAALPEIYQPIFGHPEFDSRAARNLEDRLAQIKAVHDALAKRLGRPLNVLDLGCAQGWFAFHLARAGAHVTGIDNLAANINVCNLLALENRGLNVRFKLVEAEGIAEILAGQSFDLVLELSVMHHLCFHNGKEATRELMRGMLEKIPAGLFEFALASEPVKWATAQPDDPRYLIDHVPFYRLLSEHPTHLSTVKRPLYFVSSKYWYFDGQAEEFQSWSSNVRGRRYFFGTNVVAKLYRTVGEFGEANRNAIRRAAQFLLTPPPGYPAAPKLLQVGEFGDEAWLVQEKIAGEPLDALIQAGTAYDPQAVLKGVLRALAALERTGLYHGDVRTWNVLVDSQGRAHLIDFNEITHAGRDCEWPWSPFLTFFLFVREVVMRKVSYVDPVRQPFISPFNLPEPWRSWGLGFWARPVPEWSFAKLLETLERMPAHVTDTSAPPPDPAAIALWMGSMEQFLDTTTESLRSLEHPFRRLVEAVMANHRALDHRIRQLEAALAAAQKRGDINS